MIISNSFADDELWLGTPPSTRRAGLITLPKWPDDLGFLGCCCQLDAYHRDLNYLPNKTYSAAAPGQKAQPEECEKPSQTSYLTKQFLDSSSFNTFCQINAFSRASSKMRILEQVKRAIAAFINSARPSFFLWFWSDVIVVPNEID